MFKSTFYVLRTALNSVDIHFLPYDWKWHSSTRVLSGTSTIPCMHSSVRTAPELYHHSSPDSTEQQFPDRALKDRSLPELPGVHCNKGNHDLQHGL